MTVKDIIFIVVVVLLLFWAFTKSPEVVYDTSKSDSLEMIVKQRNDSIAIYAHRSDSLDSLVLLEREWRLTKEKELNALNQAYANQIKDIDNNSVDDDIKFFSSEFYRSIPAGKGN